MVNCKTTKLFLTTVKLISIFALVEPLPAQVYNFDFLTYHDYADYSRSKSNINFTHFLFFAGNEFNLAGKTSLQIRYEENYCYFSFNILDTEKIKLEILPQFGFLISEDSPIRSWGTPWFIAKYHLFDNQQIGIRLAYKWGMLGQSFWPQDNQFDLGLSGATKLYSWPVTASISYRLRGKSNESIIILKEKYQQTGNELHYKFQISNDLHKKRSVAFLVLGYLSDNKKQNGRKVPGSYSYKAALGTIFKFHISKKRIINLSFLYDFLGRLDRKGFALIFNIEA